MTPSYDFQTLADCLAGGPMSLTGALTLAVQIAETIRHIHSTGSCLGTLSPETVVLRGSVVEIVPTDPATITPYFSPEQLQDCKPEPQSDIFSFGVLLYEMATGRKLFARDTPEAIKEAIVTAELPSTGYPELDRVLAGCLDRNPKARWQRIQQVLVELRLLLASVRRRESAQRATLQDMEAALRADMRQLESAIAARLDGYEKSVADSLAAAREEHNAAVQATSGALEQFRLEVDALRTQFSSIGERANRAEQIFDETYREVMQVHTTLATELDQLRKAVAAQGEIIGSVKVSVAKNEDLVERVVEALDALQTMVLEQVEQHAA